MRVLAIVTALVALLCTQQPAQAQPGRWYTSDQVEPGAKLFSTNCAGCHGTVAEGQVVDWRRPLPDGSFPAPPLNGSAHAWHHPLKDLLWVVSEGSVARGGKMPAFKSWLSREEQLTVIAYFQSYWPEEIYQAWLSRGGLNN